MIPAIIAFVVFTIIGLIGFYINLSRKKAVGTLLSNRKFIFFYLIFGILISCGGFIGMSPLASRSMSYFLLLQAGYAALGFLASWLYRKNAAADLPQGRFAGVFFVLANTFLGMIGFALVYHFSNPNGLAPWFALCVIPFVLPEFFRIAFTIYCEIPQEIHKVWYFPINADPVDYDQVDTSTIYMLELEYSKSISDSNISNTKLRAPISMKFGDWFRSFIENYNYKYENDPIQFANTDQTPLGWMFYTKAKALGKSRFIDPEQTIAENKISEKDIILAKRVGMVEEEEAADY
ncbi:MAG: hypothetical protein JST06_01175 [Bacteroidetes bacterium]|nr:hypothetical protein [Bacteroidota bacterium]MBS1629565.1 hypothetical protein [Bacteroidota bacterium]